MPVSVRKLEDEPILIATLTGDVTAKDMRAMFNLSADIMGDAEHTFYRITDVRTGTSNFVEMLTAVREASTGQPGSTTDPRIKTTFVGTSTWISFARNALKNPQFGGIQLAAFDNMDDALDSVHIQIANEKRSDAS